MYKTSHSLRKLFYHPRASVKPYTYKFGAQLLPNSESRPIKLHSVVTFKEVLVYLKEKKNTAFKVKICGLKLTNQIGFPVSTNKDSHVVRQTVKHYTIWPFPTSFECRSILYDYSFFPFFFSFFFCGSTNPLKV